MNLVFGICQAVFGVINFPCSARTQKMSKLKLPWFAASLLLLVASTATYAQAQEVVFDSDTVSGLGARNIGSATMSGRVSAVTGVKEEGRLTVYVGAASGGELKTANGGPTYKTAFFMETVPPHALVAT